MMNANSAAVRRETDSWQETYRDDVLVRRRVRTHRKKLKRLGLFDSSEDSAILDVCCGEGEMLDMMAQAGFRNLFGVDLAFDSKRAARFASKQWKYIAGSATQIPFGKNKFDWIVCAHSLHHLWPLENIRAFVCQSYEALKPGGRLALIDHYDSIQMRLALGLILSPVALLTPWTKLFRQQHLEEKDLLYGYLNHWPEVRRVIQDSGFAKISFQKGLLFFYCVAQK